MSDAPIINHEDDNPMPDFLKRPKVAKSKGVRVVTRKKRHVAPKPPEGPPSDPDRWADASQYRVYLHDECPLIGCGWRNVWVTEGRKWVRLCNKDGVGKIPMHDWVGSKKDFGLKNTAVLLN